MIAKSAADLARLEALLAKQERAVQQAFLEFVRSATSDAVMAEVTALLEAGDIEGALSIVDSYIRRMGGVIPQMWQAIGQAEAVALGPQLQAILPAVGIGFDPTNPRAAALMRSAMLEFIVEFTDAQRTATRNALTDAMMTGEGRIATARAFRGSIGLTQTQLAAVANYERLLRAGSREALQRDLRDRRFDPTVERAIGGEPLTQDQINRMVERYRARYLAYRSETIARTEGVKAVSQARLESFQQTLDAAGLGPEASERTWHTTMDGRERLTHAAMNGQVRPMGAPFASPSGARLMFPGDPSAPADEVVNCFHPSTLIGTLGLKGVITRHYSGELIQLHVASGVDLSVTPNHPVLTKRGWVAAGQLIEGDDLIDCHIGDLHSSTKPEIENGYASAHRLHDLAKLSGRVYRPELATVNFHGEVPDHQVEVVPFPSELRDTFKASGCEAFGDLGLKETDILKGPLLVAHCFGERRIGAHTIERSVVGSLRHCLALLWSQSGTPKQIRLTARSNRKTDVGKTFSNRATCNLQAASDLLGRNTFFIKVAHLFKEWTSLLPRILIDAHDAQSLCLVGASGMDTDVIHARSNEGETSAKGARDLNRGIPGSEKPGDFSMEGRALFSPVRLLGIDRVQYSGPVFNFETDSGLILANGLITHNCRCVETFRIRSKAEVQGALQAA